jgi:hypothetical protein
VSRFWVWQVSGVPSGHVFLLPAAGFRGWASEHPQSSLSVCTALLLHVRLPPLVICWDSPLLVLSMKDAARYLCRGTTSLYTKSFSPLEKMGAGQGPSNTDRTCLASPQLYAAVKHETFAPCKYDRCKPPSETCYSPLTLGAFTGRIFCSVASPLSS